MVWSLIQLNSFVIRKCITVSRNQSLYYLIRNGVLSRRISRLAYGYCSTHLGNGHQKCKRTSIKGTGTRTEVDWTCVPFNVQRCSLSSVKDTQDKIENVSEEVISEKLSLYQRFKRMARGYWYVLLPVHLITSVGWFGGFYYLAKSGVDVVAILESIGVSAVLIDPLRDSSAGYLALSYCMYKIATPLRYTVTLGGTTLSVRYLTKYGIIKPIPPKEKLKEMYQEKKEQFRERRENITEELKQKRDLLKERRDNITEELKQKRDLFKERRESMVREYRDRVKK